MNFYVFVRINGVETVSRQQSRHAVNLRREFNTRRTRTNNSQVQLSFGNWLMLGMCPEHAIEKFFLKTFRLGSSIKEQAVLIHTIDTKVVAGTAHGYD